MKRRSLALHRTIALAVFSVLPQDVSPSTKDEVTVHWKGVACDRDRIASDCGDAAAHAIASWSGWASSHGYSMFLNDDGRVLLLLKHKDATADLELVERTCRFVDELLESKPDAAPKAAPTGADAPKESHPPAASSSTGETAVLVQAKDVGDYQAFLEHAAELEPYLSSWIESAAKMAGCTLFRPLCSSWIELLAGQAEWDIKNELVHRLASLLIVRSFGEQPFWLLMGLSWYVESEIRGGIYCFPYRDEFVWATEHGSWNTDLKRVVKKAGTGFLEKVVGWKRGSYDSDCARLAWGFAGFLAEHHRGAIAKILEDLRALREKKGVVREGRNWHVIPGWEPSLEDQRSVVQRHAGEEFLDEFVAACTKSSK